MEIRFFAPGSLVSNLDFVEGIFGNGGDPYLPENDSALDALHWTGHTGCVILAPHLVGMRKKDLGLPHADHATELQRRDGMCWRAESELYNEGRAFKLTCRDQRGATRRGDVGKRSNAQNGQIARGRASAFRPQASRKRQITG
jgi:hypothetical protein